MWALNKTTLYRYVPRLPEEERHPIPLLLVFAAINRPFLLDMRPGNSFIEFLLDEGFDVYMLDWGEPGPEDAEMRLDDYGAEYLPRAVRRVLADSGASELSMLGYCLGSLITLLYAAIETDGPLRNLILLTPPVDMSHKEDSLFSSWLDERWFDVDRFASNLGGLLSSSAIENGGKVPALDLLLRIAKRYGLPTHEAVRLWILDQTSSRENHDLLADVLHQSAPVPDVHLQELLAPLSVDRNVEKAARDVLATLDSAKESVLETLGGIQQVRFAGGKIVRSRGSDAMP